MIYDFKLMIGIWAGGSVSFSGETPKKRDLGGAEYCCVSMAESLAARGHTVVVFTHDSQAVYEGELPLTVNGVQYYPMERAWLEVTHTIQWDVFIVSRDYPMLSNSAINTKLLVLWNHDILSNPESFREHIHKADKIFCLSTYHKAQYLTQLTDEITNKCTLKPEHITVTRNGVDVQLIQEALQLNSLKSGLQYGKFGHPTFVYSSRPERGLKYLLRDIWPHIVAEVPGAQLKVACYDSDYELLPEFVQDIHKECYELIRCTPSVEWMGSLRRLELFQVIAASHCMIYPSIFCEISCLSILESQALGTPVLTSERGALKESNWSDEHIIFKWEDVEDGKINPDVGKWVGNFINNYYKKGETTDRKLVQEDIQEFHDWNRIAEEWEENFYNHFEERSTEKPKRIIQNLIHNSDLLAAQWALYHCKNDPTLPDIIEAQSIHGMNYKEWKPLRDEVGNYLTYHHAEPESYASHEGTDNIFICPERMKVALQLIQEKYGSEKPFTLLDIGCGSGRFLYHVVKNFHNAQVMGVDFSAELCKQATENITKAFPSMSNGEFIYHCDPLELNIDEFFGDEKPDVVFCAEWLEHQTELVKAMTTVDACCKEGGLVIYTTPYGPWESLSYGTTFTSDGHEIRHHVSHFEYQDIVEMFKDVEYNIQATTIQHSPADMSILGNYVISYVKKSDWQVLLDETEHTIPVQFHTPNYHRKFLTTRPYIRVVGFMITKDEEDNITRALKPLKQRMDKILVYDTGSTDKTTDLAEIHADMVVKGYWNDDFGAARNRALDIIRTFEEFDADYIYWQDADEALLSGFKLKHYLQGDLEIFQAFIITQNHLMIDNPMSSDVPIRLFRNKPEYTFLGKIHEHILDNRDPDGNTNLFPLYIMPDVKIAHYGYITEEERRQKAVHRNWDILKKDVEENPNREMNSIFLMRDYINHVRWNLEKHRPLTDKDIELLYDVIKRFDRFREPTRQNHIVARIFYQDALRILGEQRYPTEDGRVPIHCAFVLAAKRGTLPAGEVYQPEMRWFKDSEELHAHAVRNLELSKKFVDTKHHTFED